MPLIESVGFRAVVGWIFHRKIGESSTLCLRWIKDVCFKQTVSRANTAHVGVYSLPNCHRVSSLLKRWLLGTHREAPQTVPFLQFYLDEFVFRSNRKTSGSRLTMSYRRTSLSRGLIYRRLSEQAVAHAPIKKRDLLARATIT